MGDTAYSDVYRNVDFRQHPETYVVGRGEQGVLIAQPYKGEILPYWKFKTPSTARASADKIYAMFLQYKADNDFVGMDMARKFLQMGFTRSRRYANHPSGRKYEGETVRPQALDQATSDKAESAQIFYERYKQAANDDTYKQLKAEHVVKDKERK